MNENERCLLRELTDQVARAVRGEFTVQAMSGSGGVEIDALAETVSKLVVELKEAEEFISALSLGRLEVDPPPRNHLISSFKQLQSNLRHLTWQTQQIAAGDLNQRVDFLGDFSVAFNSPGNDESRVRRQWCNPEEGTRPPRRRPGSHGDG